MGVFILEHSLEADRWDRPLLGGSEVSKARPGAPDLFFLDVFLVVRTELPDRKMFRIGRLDGRAFCRQAQSPLVWKFCPKAQTNENSRVSGERHPGAVRRSGSQG